MTKPTTGRLKASSWKRLCEEAFYCLNIRYRLAPKSLLTKEKFWLEAYKEMFRPKPKKLIVERKRK